MGADQEGDESLGGNGGILYFSRNLVSTLVLDENKTSRVGEIVDGNISSRGPKRNQVTD